VWEFVVFMDVRTNASCAIARGFAIVRVLLLQRSKRPTKSSSWARCFDNTAGAEEKRGVDELSETRHNLSSLLLTNTTIRKRSKAVPNKFFNNQQSISVGV
jgi:hypothetical protein